MLFRSVFVWYDMIPGIRNPSLSGFFPPRILLQTHPISVYAASEYVCSIKLEDILREGMEYEDRIDFLLVILP